MNSILVEFDATKSRFLITVPKWLNDRVRVLPNRRFLEGPKKWSVPAVRLNSRVLIDTFEQECFTPDAWVMVHQSVEGPLLKANDLHFPKAYSFKVQPWPHQMEALERFYGQDYFALFMEMRTGKTPVVVDYASAHWMEGHLEYVLVTSPYSVRKGWEKKIGLSSGIPFATYLLDTSNKKRTRRQFDEFVAKPGLKWMMVGHESLQSGTAEQWCREFLKISPDRAFMTADESSDIGNPQAGRSKVEVELAHIARRRAILNGTPIWKGIENLYMQYEFLHTDIIGAGDFYSFRNKYAEMGGYKNKTIVGYTNVDELMDAVAPFTHIVLKKDVFTLPPIQEETFDISMTPAQRKHYSELAKNKMTQVGDLGTLEVRTVLERMLRLHQVCGGFVSVPEMIPNLDPEKPPKVVYTPHKIPGSNPKLDALMKLVTDNDTGSTIIWCHYRPEIRLVVDALSAEFGADQVVEIHGGIDEQQRHVNVDVKFQGGAARFLVGNAATGAMGQDMWKGRTVVYFSKSFSYIDWAQSHERTQSQQQENSVLFVSLVCEDSVDEIVEEALVEKMDVAQYVGTRISEINARLAGS